MYDFNKLDKIRDPTKLRTLNKIDKAGVIRYHDTYKYKWKANDHAAKLRSKTQIKSVQLTEQIK